MRPLFFVWRTGGEVQESGLLKEEGHSIKTCCQLLNISRSGFHKWMKSSGGKRQQRDGELKVKILSIFGKSKETYGAPRISQSLKRGGDKVGKKRVARLMRIMGLNAGKKRSFRPKTTINNPLIPQGILRWNPTRSQAQPGMGIGSDVYSHGSGRICLSGGGYGYI